MLSLGFSCGGERCIANDIVVAEQSVYDEFTEHVLESARKQTVGNGMDETETTDIGAVIVSEHESRV